MQEQAHLETLVWVGFTMVALIGLNLDRRFSNWRPRFRKYQISLFQVAANHTFGTMMHRRRLGGYSAPNNCLYLWSQPWIRLWRLYMMLPYVANGEELLKEAEAVVYSNRPDVGGRFLYTSRINFFDRYVEMFLILHPLQWVAASQTWPTPFHWPKMENSRAQDGGRLLLSLDVRSIWRSFLVSSFALS